MTLTDRWQTNLDGLRAEGRYRQLTLPRGVDFSSNDYFQILDPQPYQITCLKSKMIPP